MTATTLPPPSTTKHGLKPNTVSFWDSLAIGLDSTAPAYSLAAVLGPIVAIAGTRAPAILLLSFVPMVLIAGAFYYLNRADQDCGTTFAWVTRALGPSLGWLGGWAVVVTGVLVVGSLAHISAWGLLSLVGLSGSKPAVVAFAVAIIAIMTLVSARGIEWSARVQRVLVLLQVGALLAFVLFALVRLATGDVPVAARPEVSWFLPVGLPGEALTAGLLLGVFIYWGWESSLNLTEESTNKATTPGRAGVISTVILLLIYLGVTVAIVAVAGPVAVAQHEDEGLFGTVAGLVMGPLAFILVLSIVTSGIASTQTTLLPSSRTTLSMASAGAFPRLFARVHPRTGTPAAGTWVIGVVASAWYVVASLISDDFLTDSLSALALLIAFYYALTGIACVVYWRQHLTRSLKAFLLVGVGPSIGAALLLYLLIRSVADLEAGVPLGVAVVTTAGGVLAMLRARAGRGRAFFSRRREAATDADLI